MQNKKIVLDNSKIKRYTVTAALPYTNGPVHIGHLAGVYLPADTYVRYLRSNNRDVKFICGSDENGVPITLKAKRAVSYTHLDVYKRQQETLNMQPL